MATIAEFLFEGASGHTDGWTSFTGTGGAIGSAGVAEGAQSILFDCTGAAKANLLTLPGSTRIITARFYYYVETDASGSASVIQFDNATSTMTMQARVGRKLRVLFGGGTAGVDSSAMNLNQLYLIDLQVLTNANPYTCVFKIDGVDQPSANRAVAAADMTNFRLGNTGTNTYKINFDALKLTDQSADYPLGALPILGGGFPFAGGGYYPSLT